MSNSPCLICGYMEDIPGDIHIKCNCPNAELERKFWPGCGIFPLCFDCNIVLKCNGPDMFTKSQDMR